MSIESINLRKCIIEKLSEDTKYFITKDLYDNSEKVVLLSGKQRMFYLDYKAGDIVYTAKSIKGEWKLITDTNFKMNDFLYENKLQLDKYFETQT